MQMLHVPDILSAKLARISLIMALILIGKGRFFVYSEEYDKARKEFRNCLFMCIFGMGIPIYNAFHEWWPIMQREKEKALNQGKR